MSKRKIGVWLIGALGSISTTVILGALAMRRGLTGDTGMVTAMEPFCSLDMAPVEDMEFGGCDIRRFSLGEAARQILKDSGNTDIAFTPELENDFQRIEEAIAVGIATNCGEMIESLTVDTAYCDLSIREQIKRVLDLIEDFKESRGVDQVVVINLASTEPPVPLQRCHGDIAEFEKCLDQNRPEILRAGAIYSYAAIQAGCPYINFTPSTSALAPAIVQFAEQNGVPVMGNDGKTGETLVKSVLAPMFMLRNLKILSWEGFNILGNMDGRVLDNPQNKESKIQTKDGVLSGILGYSPHSGVHINYVPSLGDQKTAWDFIHFKGFLDAKMSLQFIWQGYDSFLAAPLILDLARWAELAQRNGEKGLMPHLACYFKNPLGSGEHRLYEQFQMLVNYATTVGK
jgi:myo-inositol-1-phosphate synthase